jgi:hypothetical protein
MDQINLVNSTVESMRERGLADSDSDRLLMQAGRKGLMPWSRIGMVDKEYREPRFGQFKKRNAWSLYNAFTYVVQKSPPHHQIPAINAFRQVVLN